LGAALSDVVDPEEVRNLAAAVTDHFDDGAAASR
jgi:hypothetical protein